MNKPSLSRPESDEFASYYANYVALVEENDIVSALSQQAEDLKALYSNISEEKGLYAYEKGKWTIKELLGHMIDGERVFSYRAYRISRNDQTPLPGFEQDDYIANGNFNTTKIADMIEEFSLLRRSNVIFLKNLPENSWLYRGTASDVPVSVRAIAYIMTGHVGHHMNILKARYLNA